MQTQVASLESALGSLNHIYHESLTEGGDDGLKQLEVRDQRSHGFIQSKCGEGATLEATESADLLAETLDLQRCLMIPLASEKVTLQLQEWFANSNRERYEHITLAQHPALAERQRRAAVRHLHADRLAARIAERRRPVVDRRRRVA